MNIKSLSWLLIGGVILIVLLYAVTIIYLTWPITQLSVNSSGVFGDSFGLLTSLFSGLAFAGLIITIVMQRDELSLQRQELNLTREELSGQRSEMERQNKITKIQQFENTFFKMLELLEACRNDICFRFGRTPDPEGRNAIKEIYGYFYNSCLHSWAGGVGRRFKEECKNIDGINENYVNFYSTEHGEELGQYFRTLYNTLKLVDQSDFIDDKRLYANLVRAQLSRWELALLFYNCLSKLGSPKMTPLVKKYKILKHLEENTLPPENLEIWRNFNA